MNINWYEIDKLVEQGYIKKVTEDGLAIYNYTKKTQYDAHWNDETETCRGLIVDKNYNIIALPFKKIFNWLEGGRRSSLNSHIVNVTEKADGFLAILYRKNGGYYIASRGSFNSPHAQWATEYLNKNYNLYSLPDEITLLFEGITPQFKVVLDYNGREDLVLLAARNRFTGEYLPFFPDVYRIATHYGFSLPRLYHFNRVTDVIERMLYLPDNEEGHVVEFSDGSRFKFKGDRYLELHKLICGLSFRKVLDAYFSGKLEYYYKQMPEEFHPQIKSWENEIDSYVYNINEYLANIFKYAPDENRKEFALWANKNHKEYASYLFMLKDNKPIDHLIYDDILKNRDKEGILGESEEDES